MTGSGEIISLHVGEAGCQIGNSCWELYCLEHNIRPDGVRCGENFNCTPTTFFFTTNANKVVPRALFVDLEPSVIDEIKIGNFRKLFSPQNLISGKEDAANCFARGYITLSREISNLVKHRVQNLAENCNHIQGFLIFRAYGGGTGSGLAAQILQSIHSEFPKCPKFEFSIFPSPKLSSVIVEPYNAAFATHLSLEHSTGCFLIDNEACYDICDHMLDICNPEYFDINNLLSRIISGVTTSMRFGSLSDSKLDLNELQTNLIPYPRIQYPILTYAPLISKKQLPYENTSPASLLNACFEPSHQVIKCDLKKGKYMACAVLFRGDVNIAGINAAVASIKTKKASEFIEWSPAEFKIIINSTPPVTISNGDLVKLNRACVMIANSTAIKSTWEKINQKFDLMFSKKAFLHWYIAEGLEEADFHDTRLDLEALDGDYKEVESGSTKKK